MWPDFPAGRHRVRMGSDTELLRELELMTIPRRGPAAHALELLRPYWLIALGCGLLGIIGGLSVAGLLAVVNRGLYASEGEATTLLLSFGALCLLILIGSIGSDIGSNWVGQRIIASLRKSLARRILCAPIDQLEQYRPYRLIPILKHDVDTISDFAFIVSAFVVSLTISIGCLAYLAYLSWPIFLVTGFAIVIGSLAQGYARSHGVKGFWAAREFEDDLQKHYRAIAEGAKELRINRPRRRQIFAEQLERTVDRISEVQIKSVNLFVTARAFGTALFFVVIGLALVLRHLLWPDSPPSVVSGFVLVLLYMRGPIDQMIAILPGLSRAQVAIGRIAELSQQFSTPEPDLLTGADKGAGSQFESIELRAATYSFKSETGKDSFTLGPIDFRVQRGEIVFIVGENGSGKTTLIKLLLGLYAPHEGAVFWNGKLLAAQDRDDYRQLFTTVFSDYYLFDDLLSAQAVPSDAERYLEKLEVAHKVSIKDGAFTTTDLSGGQRKRLALMAAWLEGRPVLVFDEWAADQDPEFRKIFYTELLADLKQMGKTIVVISHDDRYFGAADRLVRLSQGRVVA